MGLAPREIRKVIRLFIFLRVVLLSVPFRRSGSEWWLTYVGGLLCFPRPRFCRLYDNGEPDVMEYFLW